MGVTAISILRYSIDTIAILSVLDRKHRNNKTLQQLLEKINVAGFQYRVFASSPSPRTSCYLFHLRSGLAHRVYVYVCLHYKLAGALWLAIYCRLYAGKYVFAPRSAHLPFCHLAIWRGPLNRNVRKRNRSFMLISATHTLTPNYILSISLSLTLLCFLYLCFYRSRFSFGLRSALSVCRTPVNTRHYKAITNLFMAPKSHSQRSIFLSLSLSLTLLYKMC